MNPVSPHPSPGANRWLLAVLAAAFALFLAYLLRYVLLPFLVAGGLAYVLWPMVQWLQERLRIPRFLAATIPFFLLLAGLAAIGLGVKVFLLPQLSAILAGAGTQLDRFLEVLFRGHTLRVGGKIYGPHDAAEAILQSARSAMVRQQALADIGIVFGVLMGFVLTMVLLFYFLVYGSRVSQGLLWVVPPRIRPEAIAVGRRAGPMIRSYVRGVLLVAAYAIVLTFLVTRYVLHLPNALALSCAVGALELIPVIGPILSIALICFIAIGQMTFWGIAGVAIFATALRLSIDQLVGPLVLGRSVNLPPPLIIFAFMAGGAIWGIMGVMVAIPAAAIIKIILEEAYAQRRAE